MTQKFRFKYFYHCIIFMPNELGLQSKMVFSSLSNSPENQSTLFFFLLDHLYFHAFSQLEMYNSFRANYVSLYVSVPKFFHIMISAMLVLETLVFNKLKSICLIGTSVIEQYSLYFRICKNTN